MLRRVALALAVVGLSAVVGSSARAQSVVMRNLFVSGQMTMFADTDGSGCPGDGTDASCAAKVNLTNSQAVGSPLIVTCNQSSTAPLNETVFGVQPSATYAFNLTEFDLMHMSAAATQTAGTFTFDPIHFISGRAFTQDVPGGIAGIVNISQRNGTSVGALCAIGGSPVTEVSPRTGPALLRNLDYVNCSTCPTTACSPDSTTPTHLRVPLVPLPSNSAFLNFIMKDVYIPITTSKKIVLSEDNPAADIGEVDLTALGACPALGGRRAAPTMTNAGLLLMAAGFLAIGSWVMGRRRAFAESIFLS